MKTFLAQSITFLVFFTAGTALHAQESEPCGSGLLHDKLLQQDESYQRSWFALEQRLLELHQAGSTERADEIFEIPVVVHIIHEGESIGQGSNISDEQILSAITALNEDFRKITGSNGDGGGVDVGIEFCLASRDPEGNSTTGIKRVDGSVIPLYATEGIQATGNSGANEEAVKELSVWPRTDYMNIWVVNEIENNDALSGIQGYAYFPINSVRDGIVMLHNAFGTTGNIKPNTALNRTLTHEVGHYFGLYHTFHNTNDCNAEDNCSTQGDRVCDTPLTPLGGSCSTPGCSGTQQVENYMDYTAETCRDMFTQGQKDRMRNTLLADRASLLGSFGCIPVTDLDAGITAIAEPEGNNCSGSIEPIVYLTNFGSSTLTSCTIHYNIDNNGTASFSWAGSLVSGSSEAVSLPMMNTGTGNHTFNAWISLPNGGSDENANNDEAASVFTISSGAGVVLEVSVDYFGSETSWEVLEGTTVVASGGPYVNNQQGTVFTENICIGEGCYTLWMYDAYGDGMSFTNGSYLLLDADGNELASGGGDFGENVSHDFCLENTAEVISPEAGISATNNNGCGSVQADFFDTSSNTPTSWNWSFPGGSPSNSSVQHPQNISYNSPGNYAVTLTVSNESGTDVITMPNAVVVTELLELTLTINEISCHGMTDGSASVSVIGGDGNYSYAWNTGNTGSSISQRGAGSYSVTVADESGCEALAEFFLVEPDAVNVNVFKSDISCHGADDGGASATASGGNGDYNFLWSDGQTGAQAEHLTEGNHTIMASDANGCESTPVAFTIVEPSEITGTALTLSSESCTGIDGSAIINPMGGTGNLSIEWSNGQLGNMLENVASGNYGVTVTDDNGCVHTSSVEVPYDCIEAPLATQLDEQSCGALSMMLDHTVVCDPIAGAAMYHWRFQNLSAGLYDEEYTPGNNPTFTLGNITGLGYGISFDVNIRVQNQDGVWSDWGPTCTLSMHDEVPETFLMEADCSFGTFVEGTMLGAEHVTGASTYEWSFSNDEEEIILLTYLNQLSISSDQGFVEGHTYHLSLRAEVQGVWSSWGISCPLYFGNSSTVESTEDQGVQLQVYPNPGDGEKISLHVGNLSNGPNVTELRVYDGSGKLIENRSLTFNAPQSELTCHFENKLAAGIYFLQVYINDQVFEEKLIIR